MADRGGIVRRTGSTPQEIGGREAFFKQFRAAPLPHDELLSNLALFINRHTWAR
jgi:hypothetical protein